MELVFLYKLYPAFTKWYGKPLFLIIVHCLLQSIYQILSHLTNNINVGKLNLCLCYIIHYKYAVNT